MIGRIILKVIHAKIGLKKIINIDAKIECQNQKLFLRV